MPVLAHVAMLLTTGDCADVTVVAGKLEEKGVQEKSYHSSFLRQAEYFATALSSNFREASERRICIEDVPAHLLFPLIDALYIEEVNVSDDHQETDTVRMLDLCRRFQFPNWVTEILMQRLTVHVCFGVDVTGVAARAFALDLPEVIGVCKDKVCMMNLAEKDLDNGFAVAGLSYELLQARIMVTDRLSECLPKLCPGNCRQCDVPIKWQALVDRHQNAQAWLRAQMAKTTSMALRMILHSSGSSDGQDDLNGSSMDLNDFTWPRSVMDMTLEPKTKKFRHLAPDGAESDSTSQQHSSA